MQIKDFSIPKYDDPVHWINKQIEHDIDWREIRLGRQKDEETLKNFLKKKEEEDYWQIDSIEEWYELVDYKKDYEDKKLSVQEAHDSTVILSDGEENDVHLPNSEGSAWIHYKNKLLNEKGFQQHVVDQIEKTNIEILRKLSSDTKQSEPIKGMVVGNVQSGKTANMAALMALAADWGWNLFIVLSGTIESLRLQTKQRLFDDLANDYDGNISWELLEHPSKKSNRGARLQDLRFESNSSCNKRYMTVCLKYASRLKDLILWLKQDGKNYEHLKILIIDDEADQASVNTAAENRERKAVSKRISELVEGLDEKNEELKTKCQAMNYIGYTATPYANVLAEGPEKMSVYPSSFIAALGVSDEYFGPQQIFGYTNFEDGIKDYPDIDIIKDYPGMTKDYPGMDIIREIPKKELELFKDLKDKNELSMPNQLKKSICWFLCSVCCMRLWNMEKPVSMLIHTSQKTEEHEKVAISIEQWFKNTEMNKIIEECREIFEYETQRFSLDDFRSQYPSYGYKDEEINKYPSFSQIEPLLKEILNVGLTHIGLDDEDDLSYSRGVHLCVDNCKNNGINEDGMHVRLAYPSENLGFSSAFIVVGGATLSRGLTIEGLVSTYFLRTVKQADTLMQMGRWFGYRKGYELLPRIWMTENTRLQFEFLSLLDQELRDEIKEMKIKGQTPKEYAPRISSHPKASFIRITAKNKMRAAETVNVNYCNSYKQTYLFDDDSAILKDNIKVTKNFLESLGKSNEQSINNPYAKKNKVWLNVDYHMVNNYLREYRFEVRRSSTFKDIDGLCQWVESCIKKGQMENWNVIFGQLKSTSEDKIWTTINEYELKKVGRTRKSASTDNDLYEKNKIINIGVLRERKDVLSDIDMTGLNDEQVSKIKNVDNLNVVEFRDEIMNTVPQLIIYCIDKDTKAKKDSKTRKDLDAPADIIGLCIGIPSGKKGAKYTEKVAIKLNFMDDVDVED